MRICKQTKNDNECRKVIILKTFTSAYNICWKNMSLVMLKFLLIKKYLHVFRMPSFNSDIKTHDNPDLGSPFTCVAVGGISVSGLKSTLPANKLTTFTIETPSQGSSEFSAVVDITSKQHVIYISTWNEWFSSITIFKNRFILSLQCVIRTWNE